MTKAQITAKFHEALLALDRAIFSYVLRHGKSEFLSRRRGGPTTVNVEDQTKFGLETQAPDPEEFFKTGQPYHLQIGSVFWDKETDRLMYSPEGPASRTAWCKPPAREAVLDIEKAVQVAIGRISDIVYQALESETK